MIKDASSSAKGLAGNQEKNEATTLLRTFWARRHMNPRKLARKPPYEVRRRLMERREEVTVRGAPSVGLGPPAVASSSSFPLLGRGS